MSKARGFADDLQAISENVENEVGRFVKLLRHDAPTAAVQTRKEVKGKANEPLQKPAMEEKDAVAKEAAAAPSIEQRGRSQAKPRQKAAAVEPIVLENVTTRLRRETNELLTEAALRQKLKKQTPATRQDIIEEALRDWLRKHGYSD